VPLPGAPESAEQLLSGALSGMAFPPKRDNFSEEPDNSSKELDTPGKERGIPTRSRKKAFVPPKEAFVPPQRRAGRPDIASVNKNWRALSEDNRGDYSSMLTKEPEEISPGPSTQTEASRPTRASTAPSAPKDRKVSFDEEAIEDNTKVIRKYRQKSDPQ